MFSREREETPTALEQRIKLEIYWRLLENVHEGYKQAQRAVEHAIGRPICTLDCGKCCQHASVLAYGFEAEYAASVLLGKRGSLDLALPRIRDWLTEPGHWTYGSALRQGQTLALQPEFARALTGRCCFLDDHNACMLHYARPVVCRGYGVVHMPNRFCPRKLGIGETEDTRTFWDPDDATNPIRPRFNALRQSVTERRFSRWAFFATMLYERFRAKDLAGLIDDGRVPLVKLHQNWGKSPLMLWQEDLERAWSAEAADQSIAEQVPLVERGGKLLMQVRL